MEFAKESGLLFTIGSPQELVLLEGIRICFAAKRAKSSGSEDLASERQRRLVRLGEPKQDEAPNGDESGPQDAVWFGGKARPQVKRGKVPFRRASSEEKRHFPALCGDLPSPLGRGESAANRRQEGVLISALAEKVKGSRPSGQA